MLCICLRITIERSLDVNNDLHLGFIDYAKTFERVKYVDTIKMLADLQIDGKDLIKNC